MWLDLYSIVWQYGDFLRTGEKDQKQRQTRILEPSFSFVFIAINILDPVMQIISGSQLAVVVTDRYRILIGIRLTMKISSGHIVNIYLISYVYLYEGRDTILADKGS